MSLLETFNVDTAKLVTENRVVLNNNLAKYVRKTLIERVKLPTYRYTDEYGVKYILEVDEDTYYFTRLIEGRESRVILQPDEIEILSTNKPTQEELKELAYYVDHVAARFGL